MTTILTDDETRQMYQITASSFPTHDADVAVKVYNPLTKSTKHVTVTLQGTYPSDASQPYPLPPSGSFEKRFSIRSLVFRVLGDTGFGLIILYTLIIATVIFLLFLYHLYVKPKQQPIVIHSPYVHPNSPYAHAHSPPPYQASPPYHHSPVVVNNPSPYRQNNKTPTRLFSVSQ